MEHLGSDRHERRVSAIARRLVSVTSTLHDLETRELRLLRMASLVHDVGRHAGEREHPSVGADMLLDDDSLPLKNRHRRALAYLTLYHRDEVPDVGEELVLRRGDNAERLRLVLAFLRAADSLDSRSLPAPKLLIRRRGRRLRIVCRVPQDSAKARRVFARRKKFRLLEELLGCKVDLIVTPRRRLKIAA
ncbi:MAG: HD domain-containing protein [Tepidisphaeraceae bacterium]|jgi:exopolyphosphatase/pppGpp-phosphohydrolase